MTAGRLEHSAEDMYKLIRDIDRVFTNCGPVPTSAKGLVRWLW
jgi:hypothetical protein